MKKPILETLAMQLSAGEPDLLGRTRIILPNRRAGIFLQQHLVRHGGKTGWAPLVYAMTDFIQEISMLEQGDPVELLFSLYDVYTRLVDTPESLDDFYHRGETMIRDFDELDKYLVDADLLFSNIMDLKTIEEPLAGLEEDQIHFIRQFWTGFHAGELTPEKKQFIQNWKLLPLIYETFREVLSGQGLAYQGMQYREIAERIAHGEMEPAWEGRTIVAGFNALNRCEKRIFAWLKIQGAEFYWDYDARYVGDPQSEAGRFLRENLRQFPPAAELEDFKGLDLNKEVRIFELPTDVLQAKTVHRILEERKGEVSGESTEMAVVLCDEELLLPVLMSLPENIEEINVTMGYPMKNTPVFGFTEALLRLHHHSRSPADGGKSFYHKDVLAILLHPYFRKIAGHSSTELTSRILAENLIMVEQQLFTGELELRIFRQVEGAAGLLDYLREVFTYILEGLANLEDRMQKALDREFIFRLLIHINKLEKLLAKRPSVSASMVESLLRKSLSGLRIPFEGEPLSGLQVMGILETRMLDFRHVVLLSMNEEIMPAAHGASSNVPYSLRLAFQMPAREDMDAIYAYYFYRLMQRAERVDLLYNSGSEGVKSGEMSRYLYQLMFDRDIPLIRPGLEVQTREIPPVLIEHTPLIASKLEAYWADQEEGRYLSPTAINTYIDCSLKFYLRYLAGIGESDEVEEEIGAAGFGTVVHDALQVLYGQIAQRNQQEIPREELLTLSRSDQAADVLRETFIKHHFRGKRKGTLEGRNIILFQVMLRYLMKIIQIDLKQAPFTLVSAEKRYERKLSVENAEGKLTVLLGGKIDRIDRTGEVLRVIDYKTGSAGQEFPSVDSLFDRTQRNRNAAAMQTLLYAWLVRKDHPGEQILPGLYVMKALFEEEFDPALLMKQEGRKVRVEQFAELEEEFLSHLKEVLQRLFDPGVPFSQRDHDQKCSYCDFAELCSRNTID
jgi:CRISPR/Cas system-associated exonuclease Cas4 (RecB family)